MSRSWATRSLAIGGLATIIDIAVGNTLVHGFGLGVRPGAMAGAIVGSTLTFFANRYVAFKESKPALAAPMVRFILVTAAQTVVHGQLVVWLCDAFTRFNLVPHNAQLTVGKMVADVVVFTVAQLFLLRYVIFPKEKEPVAATSSPEKE